MRIAYLDCYSGISGDMFLGTLIDAGVPALLFEETVAALNIGARIEISQVDRSGITATKVDVYSHGEKDLPRELYWEQRSQEREHRHHDHSDVHGDSSEQTPIELLEHNYAQHHSSPHAHEHKHKHARGLNEIRQLIHQAAISAAAKETAVAIFEALGAAESKIHNTSIDKIHFHEVGAVDAMVDIVCAAAGFEALQVNELVVSPLNVGGGTVKCAHGTLPVPAPATLELLKDAPIYSSGIQAELVTPTGAAIVKTLATRFGAFPAVKVEKVGYGAGTRDFAGHSNTVRLTIGEAQPEAIASHEVITVLEANLDDLNPQVFGYVMDRLLEEGALDAAGVPVQMKKNRPGMFLTVLCRQEDAAKLTHLIFTETTTLGVRRRNELRQTLARRWESVHTSWGDVRVKIASMNGAVTNVAPEYEDCRRIAAEQHIPIKTVMQEAMQTYSQRGSSQTSFERQSR